MFYQLPKELFSQWVNKKDLYPQLKCLDKGLVDSISAPVPGLATVVTETGSAISPTDNYSPLVKRRIEEYFKICKLQFCYNFVTLSLAVGCLRFLQILASDPLSIELKQPLYAFDSTTNVDSMICLVASLYVQPFITKR